MLLRRSRSVGALTRPGDWMLLLDHVTKDDLEDEMIESEFGLPKYWAIKDAEGRWTERGSGRIYPTIKRG